MHTEQLPWGKSTENLFALIETVLFRDSGSVRRATGANPADRDAGRARRAARRVERAPATLPVASPRLLERFEDWLARGRQRQLERYLSQSTDVFDLERRLQSLTREPQSRLYG